MPGPGGVLFLDLSTSTGWSFAASLAEKPAGGVWLLQGDEFSYGRIWASLDNQLAAAINLLRPARIGIEAPLPARFQTTPHSGRLALGLTATAEQTCYRFSIQPELVKVETARSKVIGRAHMTDQERRDRLDVKRAVVAPWIVAMGWDITEHNRADATVGLAYMLGYRARPTKSKAA